MTGAASDGLSVQESVFVHAPARRAYDTISDVTRMGEWSPESTGAVVPSTGSVGLGTRFRGKNKNRWFKWTTECRVVAAEPGKVFAFDVRALGGPISRWSYEFDEAEGGTWLTERWTDTRRGGIHSAILRVIAKVFIRTPAGERPAHNREMIQQTLQALKNHLESTG